MNRLSTYFALVAVMAALVQPAQARFTDHDLGAWAAGAISQPTPAPESRVKAIIQTEATSLGVPVALALALARVESNFDPMALSTAGARGVMQIMPRTAQAVYGVQPDSLWDLTVNIHLGLRYIRDLYDQYDQDWTLALSHYNGGSITGRFSGPHTYTRGYIEQVYKWYDHYNLTHLTHLTDQADQPDQAGPFDAATVAVASSKYANTQEPWSSVRAREIAALRARFRDSLHRLSRR